MQTITPTPQALSHLRAADPALKAAIDRIGPLSREMIPDLFAALVNSIAGQQISSRALITVWSRIRQAFDPLTPEAVLRAAPDALRACGLSGRKAGYIQQAAQAFTDGTLDPAALCTLPDDEVIARLIRLPGVGCWTAQMLLIFSLGRQDVITFDDLGLRRGMQRLYGTQELTRAAFDERAARYHPHATAAALYLWQIAAE